MSMQPHDARPSYPMSADLLRYIQQRQRTRRFMAIIAFIQFVFFGSAIIIGGLLIPGWAERIDHMGTFLSLYFTSLAAIVAWYWGVEHMGLVGMSNNQFGWGGDQQSNYGSGGYGMAAYAPPATKDPSTYTMPVAPQHAPLTKTPIKAG